MQAHSEIHKGMTVHSRDGQKLGKVVSCDPDVFMIEQGFFFPKDYPARYDYVADVREDDVFLTVDKNELISGQASSGQALTGQAESEAAAGTDMPDTGTDMPGTGTELPSSAVGSASAAETTGAVGSASAVEGPSSETIANIPLSEERLAAEKRVERAGAVQVTKEVITEQKQISVPVSHEEVRVEHVPVDGERAAQLESGTAFQREETTIPIHREQVEVVKTPVVTEEVRVSKQLVTDEQKISEPVRKEVAEVKKEGQLREQDVPPSPKP